MSLRHDLTMLRKVRGRRLPSLKQCFHIRSILSRFEGFVLSVAILVFFFGIVWFLKNVSAQFRIEVPAVGAAYTEGVVGSPQLINPLFATLNDVDMDLVRLVYSGLMRYDENGRLVMDLASRYEVSEDKKTYTFELKKDVRWHDGEIFDAADVLFTFQALRDQAVSSPYRLSFQGIEVRALDDYTVQFSLSEPFQSFLSSLTLGILPEHIWASISIDTMRLAQRNLKPIGTGPYFFKRLLKGESGFISSVELERFEVFYRQPPFIKELDFQFFREYEGLDGAIEALREGKIQGLQFIPFHLREKVKRKHNVLYTLQLPQYSALFFNQDHSEVLKDKELRKALAQGLDKERILNETILNEGTIINGPLLPGNPGYDPEFDSYLYSVAEANALLDKKWKAIGADIYREELKQQILGQKKAEIASSTSQTDGQSNPDPEIDKRLDQEAEQSVKEQLSEAQLFYRKNEAGDILKFKIVTADTPEYQKAVHVIAGFWQELGVATEISLVPPKDMAREVLRGRNYDVLLYGVIVGSDPDQFPFWHSSQIDYPGLNLSRYVNRNVDTIIQKAREISDQTEIESLFKKFQEAVLEDIPAIFLYTPTYTYVLSDKIQGFDTKRIAHPSDRFAGVNSWYIKTKHTWSFKR